MGDVPAARLLGCRAEIQLADLLWCRLNGALSNVASLAGHGLYVIYPV